MAVDLRLDSNETPLVTDLYELTMAASYFQLGLNKPACFSMSSRKLPPHRGFLVAAGLERLLEALEQFRFEQPILDYLDSLKIFEADFLAHLSKLRFTGDIVAMEEGTLFFNDEPIIEVRGPLIEGQILETLVINQIGMASLIASKAARSTLVARGRVLVDFGMRRSQGIDAGLIAARSSYLAGFAGTSNVLAGRRYGIPLYGTMAHSYVMAHDRERESFEHFVECFPKLSTLLVDTYDTVHGVENAAAVALQLKKAGHRLQAVRLDSGDLLELSIKSRRILDEQGLQDVTIFASGNLDEYRIEELIAAGAPIDAFGIGTAMVVSADAPSLDVAYKLTEYNGKPRIKTSAGKLSLPGRKQVFRAINGNGSFHADLLGLAHEDQATVAQEFNPTFTEATCLLQPHFTAGHRIGRRPTLMESCERFRESLASLPERYQSLRTPEKYPVGHTRALDALLAAERTRVAHCQD